MTELRAKTYNTVAHGTCPQCDEFADLQFVWRPDRDQLACQLCADNINRYYQEHAGLTEFVDGSFTEAVAQRVGWSAGAWDMVNPIELCKAVLAVAAERKAGQ